MLVMLQSADMSEREVWSKVSMLSTESGARCSDVASRVSTASAASLGSCAKPCTSSCASEAALRGVSEPCTGLLPPSAALRAQICSCDIRCACSCDIHCACAHMAVRCSRSMTDPPVTENRPKWCRRRLVSCGKHGHTACRLTAQTMRRSTSQDLSAVCLHRLAIRRANIGSLHGSIWLRGRAMHCTNSAAHGAPRYSC